MATLYGTSGNDVLDGTDFGDRIYGRGGNDIIHTGGGNDTIRAGGGDDTIVIGSGNNNLKGNAGNDTFAVSAGAIGVSTLADWQDGFDKIDLTDLGITSLDGLSLRETGSWTVIDTGEMDLRIKTSLLAGALSADDFVFATALDPGPDPIPDPGPAAGETLFEFNGLGLWSRPGSTGDGDFAALFQGWFGANENAIDGVSGNGYIYPEYTDVFGGFGPASIRAHPTLMENDTFDLEAFKTSDSNGFTVVGYLDGVEVGRQTFDGVSSPWTEIRPDDAIFDAVDDVQFLGFSNLDDLIIIGSTDPVTPPAPVVVPDGATLITFDNMRQGQHPDGATKIGDFVADFSFGFEGSNDDPNGLIGHDVNGFIAVKDDPFLSSPPATLQADTRVMGSDLFDLEAFTTQDADGFTIIGFRDGVELGRETFGGVGADWTEIRPDDAIFDSVDLVEFIGASSVDDVLIFA